MVWRFIWPNLNSLSGLLPRVSLRDSIIIFSKIFSDINEMKNETVDKIIQKTISDYSKIAPDFARTRTFPWRIMQEFAKFVKPNDQVLDFGCGSGRLLEALDKDGLVYVGVDPVPELVDIARQKYKDVTAFDQSARGRAQKTKRSIDFRAIDIDPGNVRLDFADNYFDHVFSIAVFHHLPSKKLRLDILREFNRVLKDDGYVFLTVWNLWQVKFWPRLLRASLMKIFYLPQYICRVLTSKYDYWGTKGFLLRLLLRFLRWGGKMSKDDDGLSGEIDFGDLFIPFSSADKKTTVHRYHHAFCGREIENLAKESGFKIEKIFYDEKKFNLCAILRKNN